MFGGPGIVLQNAAKTPVTFELVQDDGGAAPVTLQGCYATINAAGTARVIARAAESRNYYAADDVELTISVAPAQLLVAVDDAERMEGESNPAFTSSLVSRANTDGVEVRYSCAADEKSPAGDYIINASVDDPNFAATIVPGTLTVKAKPEPDPDPDPGPGPVDPDNPNPGPDPVDPPGPGPDPNPDPVDPPNPPAPDQMCIRDSGYCESGKPVTLSVKLADDVRDKFTFKGWYLGDSGVPMGTDPDHLELIPEQDTVVRAVFVPKRYRISVETDSHLVERGTVEIEGHPGADAVLVEYGNTVTIKANPNEGFRFAHWKDGKRKKHPEQQLTVRVTGDQTYKAVFKGAEPEVVIEADTWLGGTVTCNGIEVTPATRCV